MSAPAAYKIDGERLRRAARMLNRAATQPSAYRVALRELVGFAEPLNEEDK